MATDLETQRDNALTDFAGRAIEDFGKMQREMGLVTVDAADLWTKIRAMEAQSGLHAMAHALNKPWTDADQAKYLERLNAVRTALGLTPYDPEPAHDPTKMNVSSTR